MTERERLREERGAVQAGAYTTPERTTHATASRRVDDDVEVRPTDLVRWGPVLAGLFSALATLVTLSVLGLAIGFTSYDPGDPGRAFGIGAGIWGAISALLSFLVGGFIAGRTAAFSGRSSGIMNGAMVWFVTIPLLIYLLGSGIGALARTAGNVAGTAAGVAGQVAGGAAAAADDPALQATAQAAGNDPALQATAQALGQSAQATAQALGQAATDPQNVEQAADTAANTAWGTLLSLGLAAAASILGGYLGARPRDRVRVAARA
jgi:hypothetical protein